MASLGVGRSEGHADGFKSHRYRHRKPPFTRGFSSFREWQWCRFGALPWCTASNRLSRDRLLPGESARWGSSQAAAQIHSPIARADVARGGGCPSTQRRVSERGERVFAVAVRVACSSYLARGSLSVGAVVLGVVVAELAHDTADEPLHVNCCG